MCGITGFFNLQEGITHKDKAIKTLNRMNNRIFSRGPDGEGIFIDNNVAFAMRRLSIIDLDTGDQPIYNENKNIVVVFNGELYNFRELKKELVKRGHRFYTNSDTEIIVHLYEEHGENFVNFLNGMFAIALYDMKNKKVLLVRDRMGIKPLHYTIKNGTIVFASELKALIEFGGVERRLNYKSLYNFLTFEYVSAPNTIYEDVFKLMPGEMFIINQTGIKKEKYWYPEIKKEDYTINELEKRIKDLMTSSIKYRLISDVPIGIFLSGGIDSTIITGVASKLIGDINTFSIGFEEETFNELGYAKIASNYFGTKHNEMILSYKEAINLLSKIIEYLDEPLADASVIPTYLVSMLSRKHITVALSGDGGDELFLGYDTYKAYKISKLFRWIPDILNGFIINSLSLIPASSKRISLEFKLKKFFSALKYKPEITNYLWWGAYPPRLKEKLFNREILDKINMESEFEPIEYYKSFMEKIDAPLDRINFLDLHLYLQDDLLPKVDRMSMANSLEVRVPFLDHRVVELALSIKNNLRLKGLNTKYILKRAMNEFIPPELKKRPKIGFDIPLGPWLRNELKDYMLELLDKKKIEEDGIFNYEFIDKIIKDHLSKKNNNRQLLWPLIIFQNWKNIYKPQL
jgi:asparagine synthase (glutamine-hydrolysing)